MPFEPFQHHRHSIRLKGYDYTTPGAYFITIAAYRRLPIFGEIVDGAMRLNENGEIANGEWMRTAEIRHEIALDEFIVMPNHFHAIVNIVDCGDGLVAADGHNEPTVSYDTVGATGHDEPTVSYGTVGAQRRCAPTDHTDRTDPPKPHVVPNSIGAIIRAYKSAVTYWINQSRGTPGAPVWQRNYHEHIIRNADELSRIRKYIRDNPAQWDFDSENRSSIPPK